jgi:hypothetical protein
MGTSPAQGSPAVEGHEGLERPRVLTSSGRPLPHAAPEACALGSVTPE